MRLKIYFNVKDFADYVIISGPDIDDIKIRAEIWFQSRGLKMADVNG